MFIGLDLSLTATGVSVLFDGQFTLTTLKAPSYLTKVERLVWIVREIDKLIVGLGLPVKQMAIEGYSMNSRNGREAQGELGGLVRVLAFSKRIPVIIASPHTVKKYATGKGGLKGKAGKARVMKAARDILKLNPKDDNQADAAWLSDIARAHHDGEKSSVSRREALAGVEILPGRSRPRVNRGSKKLDPVQIALHFA